MPEAQRNKVADEASAVIAMLSHPALIKRPVLEINGKVHVGFKTDEYASLLN